MNELSPPVCMDDRVLVRVKELRKYFSASRSSILSSQERVIKAVDGVSFDIKRGETLGLVGESGCGKSTTGQVILQLQQPTSGKVYFDGVELTGLKTAQLRALRPKAQMIFQDSGASFNPRHSIAKIMSEPLRAHGDSKKDIHERVSELLALVGLNPNTGKRHPHELSRGQRQLVNIARAFALNPSFVVCDEPTSALDTTTQAQVLKLLKELKERLGLTYLFIAHDLRVVRHIADRVVIMYLGKVMELASWDSLYRDPLHPYTQLLLAAAQPPTPKLGRKRKRIILTGEVPSPSNLPGGCVFNTRCPLAFDECYETAPAYREVRPSHFVACHLV